MATPAQKSNHVTRARNAARAFIAVVHTLNELQAEYIALGLNTLTDGDMVGENTGLTALEVADLYTALAALNAYVSSGWASVYYKLT